MGTSFLVLQSGFLLLLCLVVAVKVQSEECNRFSDCKGPTRYYEDLNCKPIYENPGDCCATRYDCSHLNNNRSADKCYINGREYAIGEELREEDNLNPCDIGCVCQKGSDEIAEFRCAVLDCPYEVFQRVEEGCYIEYTPDDCCGTKICNKSEEDRFYCENEGKLYKDGQKFYPEKSPDLECFCMEGYRGDNVAPFCRRLSCGTELRDFKLIRSNCAPIFYATQAPQSSCSIAYRCQNDYDFVISSKGETPKNHNSTEIPEEMKCKFGNVTMNIGDELNQDTNLSSVCIKCVCEVPPTPTCQRIPELECEMAKHFKFD